PLAAEAGTGCGTWVSHPHPAAPLRCAATSPTRGEVKRGVGPLVHLPPCGGGRTGAADPGGGCRPKLLPRPQDLPGRIAAATRVPTAESGKIGESSDAPRRVRGL